jgi:hydrogenase nickel incorporation protein HypB
MDLAAAAEFDRAVAYRSIQAVRPGMEIFEASAKTGEGMGRWLDWLLSRRDVARATNQPRAQATGFG